MTIVCTRKGTQRTTTSEQSKTWIMTKGLKKKYIYTPQNTGLNQDKIAYPHPKVNSVRFDEPYDHINHMENTHKDTHTIDTQEQDT